MDIERWEPVGGFPDYEVSSHGNVRSLKFGRTRLLKPNVTRKGYHRVNLVYNGRRASFAVHRLVALAFLGKPLPEQTHCCHRNGDPGDNRVTNLRWDTPKGNESDKLEHGTWHLNSKLSEQAVREIIDLYATGNYSQWGLARRFGVNQSQVSLAVSRRSWAHAV